MIFLRKRHIWIAQHSNKWFRVQSVASKNVQTLSIHKLKPGSSKFHARKDWFNGQARGRTSTPTI